jgi:ankyrin repeat protein
VCVLAKTNLIFYCVIITTIFSIVDACSVGDELRVRQLLAQGVSPNVPDITTGQTALLCACCNAQNAIVSILVNDFGADLNAVGRNGASVVHVLVESGNYDAALWMVRRGANLNVKDVRGRTAVSISSEFAALVANQPDLYCDNNNDNNNNNNVDCDPMAVLCAVPVRETKESLGLGSLSSMYTVTSFSGTK